MSWFHQKKKNEALLKAVNNVDLKAIQKALRKGAEIDCKDDDGYTPLCRAYIRDGNEEIVSFLLENGADVNAQWTSRRTPLHNACIDGRDELVSIFLKNGANVKAKDAGGDTPLHHACRQGHDSIVSILWQHCAKVSISITKNNAGQTPLIIASMEGHDHIVSSLLNKGADANNEGDDKRMPLHWACAKGHDKVVLLLLDAGAFVNAKDENRQTPLCLACMNGHDVIVAVLLEKGADPNITDCTGNTPLQYARAEDKQDCVGVLQGFLLRQKQERLRQQQERQQELARTIESMEPRLRSISSHWVHLYRDPSRVGCDASSLLRSPEGQGLSPNIAPLTENNGDSHSTLVLQGTIAFHFGGDTYHQLVDIYLPPTYPSRPAVCFVRLGAVNMYLKPMHPHVGSDGHVYLPYLHEWRPHSHDLVGLVVSMSSVFSNDPPVFTRHTQQDQDRHEEERCAQQKEDERRRREEDESNRPLCAICMSNAKTHAFLPCGHLCVCEKCAYETLERTATCPICRNASESVSHIFIS